VSHVLFSVMLCLMCQEQRGEYVANQVTAGHKPTPILANHKYRPRAVAQINEQSLSFFHLPPFLPEVVPDFCASIPSPLYICLTEKVCTVELTATDLPVIDLIVLTPCGRSVGSAPRFFAARNATQLVHNGARYLEARFQLLSHATPPRSL
jgi:hypothetical protein